MNVVDMNWKWNTIRYNIVHNNHIIFSDLQDHLWNLHRSKQTK